jgi:hypothetical protein
MSERSERYASERSERSALVGEKNYFGRNDILLL